MANGELPPDDNKPSLEPKSNSPWGRRNRPEDYGQPSSGSGKRNPLFGGDEENPPNINDPKKPDTPPPGTKPLPPQGPKDWLQNLSGMNPEDEQQTLFYLGWMAGDVPSHVRAAARAEYVNRYGPLTEDDWKAWRRKMGYGNTA